MKSKKWIVITLISLLLMAAAAVVTFVVLLPKMKENKALDKLAAGEKSEATELFGEMDNEKRESLKEDVKDIVVYTANQYLEGKKNYNETFDVFEAVEEIRNYRGMTAEAFGIINEPKLIELYEEAVTNYQGGNGGSAFEKSRDNFRNVYRMQKDENSIGIYYGWDEDEEELYDKKIDTALDNCLKDKYTSYQAGTLNSDKMNDYCDVAEAFWYSEYAYDLDSILYYDKVLGEDYDRIKQKLDAQEYFEVIDAVDGEKRWYGEVDAWNNWASKFDDLRNQAIEKGKTYYVEQAVQAANEKNTYEVESLTEKMKEYFGEDFDLSAVEQAVKDNTHLHWQECYVGFFEGDWRKRLNEDLQYAGVTAELVDCTKLTVDDIDPQYVTLYDLDNDGTPEMCLRGTTYIAVYRPVGSEDYIDSILEGVIAPMGFGDPPYIVEGLTQTVDDKEITAEALIYYHDSTFFVDKIVSYSNYQGTDYYLHYNEDGDVEMIDFEAYQKEKAEIEEHLKKSIDIGVKIDQYKEYIYGYTS